MTTTRDIPSLPALADKTLTIGQIREQGMAAMQARLNEAWASLDQLPDAERLVAQNALMLSWDTATAMSGQWAETQELLLRSVALVEMQQLTIEELAKQRDGALDELSELLNALENADGDHPVVHKLLHEMRPKIYERAATDLAADGDG